MRYFFHIVGKYRLSPDRTDVSTPTQAPSFSTKGASPLNFRSSVVLVAACRSRTDIGS
jgi:hypothetical protein